MADVSGEAGQQPVRGAQIRKVAAASFIGTTIEWYDFFVYGTAAALVFGVLFFPEFSPTAGRSRRSAPSRSGSLRGRSGALSSGITATGSVARQCLSWRS